MLKRNLIIIAIAILGLGTTSVLGQAADWEIKPAVKKTKIAKKPKQVQPGNSGGTISNQRTKQPLQEKLGNFEIQIAKPKTANLGDTGTHEVGHKERRRKQNGIVQDYYAHSNIQSKSSLNRRETKKPHKTSTQKRQHEPCKAGDCK